MNTDLQVNNDKTMVAIFSNQTRTRNSI